MAMNTGSIKFIIWMANNTSTTQSNVRFYKNKAYFIDREETSESSSDGGLNDLWDVYVKEMIG